MQPLTCLALSHTSSISVRHFYLRIATIWTCIHTELSCWISPRRCRTREETWKSNIIAKSIGTDLHTPVVATQSLLEIACRAVVNTFICIVILPASGTVSSTFRISISIFKHKESHRTWRTPCNTPHCVRIGDKSRRTLRNTSIHRISKRWDTSVIIESPLSAVSCAFHQWLDGVVSTTTILHTGSIRVINFIRLTIRIRGTTVICWWVHAGSLNIVTVITPVGIATWGVVAIGAAPLTTWWYSTAESIVIIAGSITYTGPIDYNFGTIRTCFALVSSGSSTSCTWTITSQNSEDSIMYTPVIVKSCRILLRIFDMVHIDIVLVATCGRNR